MRYDVVIVGAGHAGAHAATELRKAGFAGSILMMDAGSEWPHERPPLSKEYLAGEKTFERLMFRPTSFWNEQQIAFLPGAVVSGVDANAKMVSLSDGKRVDYGTLVWAAGGHARKLACEGSELEGILSIRRASDTDQIIKSIERGAKRVVVIGGGYIGLEAAATLSGLGCETTVIEATSRLLGRVTCEPISRFYEQQHRARGVDVRLNSSVARIEGAAGRADRVILSSGEALEADLVIAGIGILPTIEPLVHAGAASDNGVIVNERCETSLPDIFAIGDCAARLNCWSGSTYIRMESIHSATEMARIAALAICEAPIPPPGIPWFWSNQFDLRLQTLGIFNDFDDQVMRGNPMKRSFSVVYLKDRRVIAMDCINATRDFAQGRLLVGKNAEVDPARLVDPKVPLKEVARSVTS
ncbi:pyridine nucleotide-disulfide oxidoreductase [Erythrobacter sp. KY5]|uniref:NAD(P)/FAD-dependent oxidoreductase n=1 Tax=Erythrobacter sp. KY5 TaxID=2011159 RepID=UPI000DBEF2D5|nr:FAD-dependent oxidoreductase [Erythrobacter sp. KY5]AWW74417.1 pyridine nucleotide-disulfide oxidoreductase [Erythrobacter sp. KY5]